MILTYTREYLQSMLDRDKVKNNDLDSIKEWFRRTPLGHELTVQNISEDNRYIRIELG